jgi:hypothetical protein
MSVCAGRIARPLNLPIPSQTSGAPLFANCAKGGYSAASTKRLNQHRTNSHSSTVPTLAKNARMGHRPSGSCKRNQKAAPSAFRTLPRNMAFRVSDALSSPAKGGIWVFADAGRGFRCVGPRDAHIGCGSFGWRSALSAAIRSHPRARGFSRRGARIFPKGGPPNAPFVGWGTAQPEAPAVSAQCRYVQDGLHGSPSCRSHHKIGCPALRELCEGRVQCSQH